VVDGERRFPFGAPVKECGVETPDKVEAFVLGAYPSALHVRWVRPDGVAITAMAVDNEPSVFWDGEDEQQRVDDWARDHFDDCWGSVTPSGNGPSGKWVKRDILRPLQRAGIRTHFITDCLTTYRVSDAGQEAIDERYLPFAAENPRLQPPVLSSHPSEGAIVREALNDQKGRIAAQVAAATPAHVVTLGDAAARVVAAMSEWQGTGKLSTTPYGVPRDITLAGVPVRWSALIHPAARGEWQERHQKWLDAGGFNAAED
jgi:hypothetical protein